jgi:hypothetical protein
VVVGKNVGLGEGIKDGLLLGIGVVGNEVGLGEGIREGLSVGNEVGKDVGSQLVQVKVKNNSSPAVVDPMLCKVQLK